MVTDKEAIEAAVIEIQKIIGMYGVDKSARINAHIEDIKSIIEKNGVVRDSLNTILEKVISDIKEEEA